MDLQRFLDAQDQIYPIALKEIQRGKKVGHWIWFIFPQLKGLGHSYNSNYYGINGFEEAKAYLNHPILAQHLRETSSALLNLPPNMTAVDVLGTVDTLKVKSSMTLFYYVSRDSLYSKLIDRFYNGEIDFKTWYLLDRKLNYLMHLYMERSEECNEIIEALGCYEATRTMPPTDIPLCFRIHNDWFLLEGFCFIGNRFSAYIADLRTGPPDIGIIDAIAIPSNILDKVISLLNNIDYGKESSLHGLD